MAKSRSIGGIYAELSLRDKNFASGLKNAKKEASAFQKIASGVGGKLAAIGIAAPFVAMGAAMKSAIDAGGELQDMMTSTGASGGGLLVMQKAFENAGLAANDVPAAIFKMQKALAGANEDGEATANAFAKIGLSIEDLQGLDAVTAFQKTAGAIATIGDTSARTAAAMNIFGKSGGNLIAVMADGEAFTQARQQLGSLTETLPKMAGDFDMVGDSMGQWNILIKQIGVSLATDLLPVLKSYAELMNSLDTGDLNPFSMFSSQLGSGAKRQAALMANDWANSDPLSGKSRNEVNDSKLAAANAEFWNKKGQERQDAIAAQADEQRKLAAAQAVTKAAALAEYNAESKLLTAKLAGNEQLVKSLEREQAIREEIATLVKAGFTEGAAAGPAAALVDARMRLDASPAAAPFDAAPNRQADEYLRRGLMAGGSISPQRNKSETLLESIDKTLKAASKDGVLKW